MIEINNFTLTKVERMRDNPQPYKAAAQPKSRQASPIGNRNTANPATSTVALNTTNKAAAPQNPAPVKPSEKPQSETKQPARQPVKNIRTRDTLTMPPERAKANDATRAVFANKPAAVEYRLAPAQNAATPTPQSAANWKDFLKRRLGRNMCVQFLMGENGTLEDKTGVLVEIGTDYLVLKPADTRDLLLCDLNSVRFVRIFE